MIARPIKKVYEVTKLFGGREDPIYFPSRDIAWDFVHGHGHLAADFIIVELTLDPTTGKLVEERQV